MGNVIIFYWQPIFLPHARLLLHLQWMKICGIILLQKKILKSFKSFGNTIIPVEKGELASGLFGDGRMAEPEQIIQFINDNFFLTKPLRVKKH